jgi:nucleotide-binding universal stress UspA family protein
MLASNPKRGRPNGPGGSEMHDVIAVGICDSSASRTAVEWVLRRAALTGSAVDLVHVLDDLDVGEEVLDEDAPHAVRARRFLLREARLARSLAPGVRVRASLLRGSVMWELTRASIDADLVVVGTHKTGFIHGTIYGSTSLHLAAAARCPVVVVPVGMTAQPHGVMVGADESPAGYAALAVAAADAAATRQDLVIVRVWSTAEGDDERDREDRQAADRSEALGMLARFAALARTAHPGLTVQVRAIEGSSARALVAASATAQLLVLGGSRSGGPGTVLGAVCHDALMNIVSPTAIVHVAEGEPLEGIADGRAVLRPIS